MLNKYRIIPSSNQQYKLQLKCLCFWVTLYEIEPDTIDLKHTDLKSVRFETSIPVSQWKGLSIRVILDYETDNE